MLPRRLPLGAAQAAVCTRSVRARVPVRNARTKDRDRKKSTQENRAMAATGVGAEERAVTREAHCQQGSAQCR